MLNADLNLCRLLTPEALANPYPFYRRLRESDPVHWDPLLHVWVVTRYADVLTVLRRFSSSTIPSPEHLEAMGCSSLSPIAKVLHRQMFFMDGAAHARLRSLASTAFSSRRIEVLQSHIQNIAERLLDGLVERGRMDVVADFAGQLPAIVTAEMLGVPVSDISLLKRWSSDFGELFANFQFNAERAPQVLRSLDEMALYFSAAIRDLERHPNDGLICSLSKAEIDGARLTEDEVIANAIVIMTAGQETTTNMIGNSLYALLQNPEEMRRLREDPTLIPSALEELLRFESPSQYSVRVAAEDVMLGGKQIRKGQAVVVFTGAGNRDPERFPEPDRLDINRKDNRHLAFGWAAHFCFGAPLARMEGQTALAALLRRLPELTLGEGPFAWRENLGLRGLKALPVRFEAQPVSRRIKSGESLMPNSAQLSDSKKQLLERFLRGEMGRQSREVPISPRVPGEQVPLAPCQRPVWISGQMTYPTPAYNEPLTIHYRGELDHPTLERSFNELIRRHEIWRTSFSSVNGQVMQVVHDNIFISIPLVDLTILPEAEREAEALQIATADAKRPFDPGVGPLVRGKLVRIGPQDHRLYLTVHHVVFDAMSISRVMLPELQAVYEAFAAGLPSPLPDPRFQFADYALWQERTIANHSMAREKNYWRKQLADAPPNVRLPFDRQRPAVRTYRGGVVKFAFPAELTAALKRASRAEGVSLYMFLLASFKALLHRYSGQADIVVGGVADIRRPEFENLIGFFLNTIALRTRPSGELSFHEYLLSVRDTVLDALAHADMPFDDVVREAHPSREPSRHPLFQVMFAVEPPAPPAGPGWHLTTTDVDTGASKFDLYVEAFDLPDGLVGRFSYSSDLFDPATIERMIGHWQMLLAGAISDRTAKLSELPILTPEESQQLRVSWNDTSSDVPRTTIHGMFEAQAAHTPLAIAVITESDQLTYRALNERANRLAQRLRLAGAGPGTIVGLCVSRSSNMVSALLAILKAGAAYVPLDPSLPAERLAFLVSDAQSPVILTERSLDGSLPRNGAQVIYCDECMGSGANLEIAIDTDDLAYLLYTSGSTGKPKGVEIPHSAVVNFLISMQQQPGFTANDTLLAVTTLSFDIAALEIYLPLVTGGKLVVASHDDAIDPGKLIERMQMSACTVMQATPATWRALIDFGWSGSDNLKILCGGESLPRDLAQQLLPRCAQLWNMYGPTETTIWSTVHHVTSVEGPISIGRPIANTQIFVLDANRNVVPAGVVGELYIGGAGLARGYLRRAELTQERFIQSPFDPQSRLYRVGDLGRWLPDGTLECLGRVDDQVKIRGFRIELEEIEAAIGGHPEVQCAAVRAWPDPFGSLSLVAYVVAPLQTDLRSFLQQKLPEYMVPARFVFMETLPLTPNGKVDRKALAEPSALPVKPEFVGPGNEIEQQISDIWESILDVRPIGMHDNFFELGDTR